MFDLGSKICLGTAAYPGTRYRGTAAEVCADVSVSQAQGCARWPMGVRDCHYTTGRNAEYGCGANLDLGTCDLPETACATFRTWQSMAGMTLRDRA